MAQRPIGIYYEHPDWFKPLFAELIGVVAWERIDADRHRYDPTRRRRDAVWPGVQPHEPVGIPARAWSQYSLHAALPRPSRTDRRAGGQRRAGVPARDLEGAAVVAVEIAQPAVPGGAGNQSPVGSAAAAVGLRFPIVVKANIGGSGAGIVRFDAPEDLQRAVDEGRVELGSTNGAGSGIRSGTGRAHHARGMLGGKYLYAINVYSSGEASISAPPTSASRRTAWS